ncbi:MAG: ATP-binding protein [Bacteroides sp.]|nr:ATP-binding protein [Bacteroides sp.]
MEQTYHLFQQSYSQGSTLYIANDGTIYIGGTNGLASLPEQYLYDAPDKGKLCFEKLMIFNQEVLPDDATGILKQTLNKTSDIRLKYDQNNITVTFSTFSYLSERDSQLEYCFENLDKHWTQTSGNSISYTNIPPGNYTLRVRLVEPDAAETQEIALGIHVAAPFYANPYAYALYALLFIGLVYAFFHFKMRQERLQASLEGEKKEKERIEELNQTKLRFFTNISHEFRTPLTLIIGQLEAIMQINELEPAIYKRILRVYKNTWHMRDLITELLDFRKQEQGYLKLKVEERDIVSFTHEIYGSFYEYSQMKGISYSFKHAEETLDVWFDPVQLQKAIFNLLSNAFKYTAKGGAITVSLHHTSTQAAITVSDNGVGIPEEAIQKIFDRFYQADSTSSSFSLGTGIGLALAKGIMEAHHGKIEIKSTVNEGSSFTLLLPLGNQHFNKEDFAVSKHQSGMVCPENIPAEFAPEMFSLEAPTEAGAISDKPVLLLVEDNEELLEMLNDMFSVFYEVHTARNGREGLAAVAQVQPDIIVSDVMMPEMSGKEMCYKLKNNVEYSHIPIVLLTAQNSVEYIVEGYMFGADDYVTKPFNVKILLARCSNLIRNKQQIIAHYSSLPAAQITESIPAVNVRDKELLDKSIAIIKENFDSPDFDVTSLASALCMGRSKLYMQFKQTIGLTPNEFILKVKLDEAMSMLKNNPELNVSEISARLGFSSVRYFSKCFKAFFGVAPLGIRKKKQGTFAVLLHAKCR